VFTVGIVFVFYDAERVLSAIAKFFVHLLGNESGRVKWEKERYGKRKGRDREGYGGA